MYCNTETRTATTGFMFTFIKAKECIQTYRTEPFLFTIKISANVNKSLCPLLFWPFPPYPFVIPTVQRHLLKFFTSFAIPPKWRHTN